MPDRTTLLQVLQTVTAARRDAVAELDAARAAHLTAGGSAADEELLQTHGALVRQLENAARELHDAIRTIDQRERVEARLAEVRGDEA